MTNIDRHYITVRLGEGPGWGAEYWTEEDWEEHRKYVEKLKKEGRYLEEVEMTVDVVRCPQFDNYITGHDPAKGEDRSMVMLIPTNELKLNRFMEDTKDIKDYEDDELVDLACQLHARSANLHASKEVHERSVKAKEELKQRLNQRKTK